MPVTPIETPGLHTWLVWRDNLTHFAPAPLSIQVAVSCCTAQHDLSFRLARMKSCAARVARLLPVALLLGLFTASLTAQQQPPPAYKSAGVHPDGSITFRYYDPGAANVELILEDTPGKLPMEKASTGIWVITTHPLKPEIYGYRFRSRRKNQMHYPLKSSHPIRK